VIDLFNIFFFRSYVNVRVTGMDGSQEIPGDRAFFHDLPLCKGTQWGWWFYVVNSILNPEMLPRKNTFSKF